MTEAQFHIVRTAGFLLALGFALSLKRLRPHAPLHGSWRVNAALWILNAIVLGAVCGACACSVARWAAASNVGLLNLLKAPLWLSLPATILTLDLVSYAWHRANHGIAFLWRFHRVHHSDLGFTVSTGVRFHPGELLLSLPVRLAAVAVIGTPAMAVVVFEIAFTVANLFEHGNIDLPVPLERRLSRLLVMPALHRRHHMRRRPELDSNFGTIFTFWDRLLGTYGASSSAVRVQTGLPGIMAPVTLRRTLVLPLSLPPGSE